MKVTSEKQFVNSMDKLYTSTCYYSVFTNWQRQENYYDTIFLETDYSSKNVAKEGHISIMNYFKENGYHARVLFSGRRSYHYYLDFPLTKFKDYKDKVKQWVRGIPGEFDKTTIGDSAQLARVAGTIHEKTGMYCVPFGSMFSSTACVDLQGIKRMPEIVMNKDLPKDLKGINTTDKYYSKVQMTVKNMLNSSIPPCILAAMKYIRNTGECDHLRRLHLGTYLTKTMGPKLAVEFFRNFANDYKPSLTTYHINYFITHNWNCYGCDKVIAEGDCPLPKGTVCSYYPSINHSI